MADFEKYDDAIFAVDDQISKHKFEQYQPNFLDENLDVLFGTEGKNRVQYLLRNMPNHVERPFTKVSKFGFYQDFPATDMAHADAYTLDMDLSALSRHKFSSQSTERAAVMAGSNYASGTAGHKIICDKGRVKVFNNGRFMLLTSADGCSWGEDSANAAEIAVTVGENQFITELLTEHRFKKQLDIREVGRCLMLAATKIEEQLCQGREKGTTTFMQTVVSACTERDFYDVCVYNVGDIKVFLYRPSSGQVIDITAYNREGVLRKNSAPIPNADPGGRLGRVSNRVYSDLRNAYLYHCRAQKGDVLIQVSDGIHDNLHKDMMGVNSDFSVREFMESAMEVLLKKSPKEDPKSIAKRLVIHANKLTALTRRKMEEDQRSSEPKEKHFYPGKQDHYLVSVAIIGS